MSTVKAPELPDVPLVTDLVQGRENQQILAILLAGQAMAWPLFAPAETAQDRVQVIRRGYSDMFKDSDVASEARRAGIDIDPVSGEEIQSMLKEIYATPEPIVKKARELAGR